MGEQGSSRREAMSSFIPVEVLEMGKIHFEGNITPHIWYEKIKFQNGRVDLVSIILLSEIVYWYRPTYVRDEVSGKVIATHKKFKADALQKSKQSLADQFGLTERQVKDSLARLEQLGLITRDYRTIITESGMKLPNVLFIKIHPKKIEEISFVERQPYDVSTSYPRRLNAIPPTLKRHTNTENTTKITKEEREEALPPPTHQAPSAPSGPSLSFSEDGLTADSQPKLQHKVNYRTNTLKTKSNYEERNSNKSTKSKENKLKNKSKDKDSFITKESYRDNVTLSVAEHEKLLERYGKFKLDWMLDYLDAKKGSTGRKYVSDYHVFAERNWVNQEYQKQKSEGKIKERESDFSDINLKEHLVNKNLCEKLEGSLSQKNAFTSTNIFEAKPTYARLIVDGKVHKEYHYEKDPESLKSMLLKDLEKVFSIHFRSIKREIESTNADQEAM